MRQEEKASIKDFLETIFPDGGYHTATRYISKNGKQYFAHTTLEELKQNKPIYYCISAVPGDGSSRKGVFKSLNVLVCDDVGTSKATTPDLEPSYIIETSPNNFQYGYILTTPQTDLDKAKQLIRNLRESGKSDAGLSSYNHMVRLPGGINGKLDADGHPISKTNFKVTLRKWSPNITYSYDFLLDYFKPMQKQSKSQPFSDEDILHDIPDKIYEGGTDGSPGRDVTMASICGRLLVRNLPIDVVLAKMIEYNEMLCVPPLPLSDIQRIVESVNSIHQRRQQELNDQFVSNIIHIQDQDRWYDHTNGVIMTAESLNTTYLSSFPKKITKWLPFQDGFQQVAATTWIPVAYGDEQLIIEEGKKRLLNTWQGFAIEPQEGPIQPWLDHLAHVVPEPEYREPLIWWMAYQIQHPDQKCQWQPAVIGIEGAGKDSLFEPLAYIFGSSFKSMGQKEIESGFDDELIGAKIVVMNEIKLSGRYYDFYKRITTSQAGGSQSFNKKMGAKITQQNLFGVIITSNHLDALKLSPTDRRVYVLRAPEPMTEEQKQVYISEWLKGLGPSHLFHYLLNYDLSAQPYNPGTKPFNTSHFDDMFDMTKSDTDIHIFELLDGLDVISLPILIEHAQIEGRFNGSNKLAKTWLESNGWARWDHTRKNGEDRRLRGIPPQGGAQETLKTHWYVRKGSKFVGSKPADMYAEAKRIEAIFNNSKY